MISQANIIGEAYLTRYDGHLKMLPFDLRTLAGIPQAFLPLVRKLVAPLKDRAGTAFLTVHGQQLKATGTLRRPGAHTDGNYEPVKMDFSGGGWKVGENGPPVGSALHTRQYLSDKGGLILLTNYCSAAGWLGEFDGMPGVGGDCSHLTLPEPTLKLEAGKVYYGNNHFIHTSNPVDQDVHRTMLRITLPEHHQYQC